MGKTESHFHMATEVASAERKWPGITDKILSHEEEIYVLSGRIYDGTLQRWVGAGEYACRPPGQKHGPFKCAPDEGATVLLVNTHSWAAKNK